ncbi:MAG TPA: thiol:disulfide interchange protein, partial [Prolixibacteraceae bacterium]|nr:thiol:disulfide interchange protein [Prolixibacteraceae bacterium]
MMIKRILLIAALILLGQIGMAQVVNPVKWSFSKKQLSDTQAELQFKAVIEKGWHLYSDKLPEGGPIATSVSYDDTTLFKR